MPARHPKRPFSHGRGAICIPTTAGDAGLELQRFPGVGRWRSTRHSARWEEGESKSLKGSSLRGGPHLRRDRLRGAGLLSINNTITSGNNPVVWDRIPVELQDSIVTFT